jgi:hypothetical protein
MLRISGIMINLKKIPAAVYEDNTNDPYEAMVKGVACRYLKTDGLREG